MKQFDNQKISSKPVLLAGPLYAHEDYNDVKADLFDQCLTNRQVFK